MRIAGCWLDIVICCCRNRKLMSPVETDSPLSPVLWRLSSNYGVAKGLEVYWSVKSHWSMVVFQGEERDKFLKWWEEPFHLLPSPPVYAQLFRAAPTPLSSQPTAQKDLVHLGQPPEPQGFQTITSHNVGSCRPYCECVRLILTLLTRPAM